MLEAIRQRFTGWIAILVISLIAVTLVISFGNMDQTPIEDDVVITVNDTEITLFEYREEYSGLFRQKRSLSRSHIPTMRLRAAILLSTATPFIKITQKYFVIIAGIKTL